jgi:hypothetical protein
MAFDRSFGRRGGRACRGHVVDGQRIRPIDRVVAASYFVETPLPSMNRSHLQGSGYRHV